MGVLTSMISLLFKISIVLFLIAVVPGIPPHIEFQEYSITPSLPLEGSLAINEHLNKAERLFEDVIHGPEDLLVHDGALYTTLHGGHVVKIEGDKITPVAKFGQKCDGFHEEEKCGRPLGITIDKKGKLYVADCYYGIFKVDVSTGKSEQLVGMDVEIEGKKPRIPNSVAIDNDSGVLYWTDSSTSHSLHDGLFTLLSNGNGRVIKYNPATKTNTVLVDNLHFPNGVVLSDDSSFLVIAETMKHRLIKYHIKGPKAGELEVFVDGLPGMPDNINVNKLGHYVVSLVTTRDADNPSPIERLSPFPLVRKLLARLMYLGQRTVSLVQHFYPLETLKTTAHIIGHFEMIPLPGKKRAAVLIVTRDGKISRSLYATDGLTGVSSMIEHGGYYYLGSPINTFLARVKSSG